MNDITIDHVGEQEPNKRPTFLLVLCILTFIGSGIGVISALGILLFLPASKMYAMMVDKAAKVRAEMPPFEEYAEWLTYNTIVSLIVASLGLIGGIMMYKRKKNGFYIYVFSWIASITMTIISHKHISDSAEIELFPFAMVLTGLIMAAFVIMYSVNLKHMK